MECFTELCEIVLSLVKLNMTLKLFFVKLYLVNVNLGHLCVNVPILSVNVIAGS